VSFFIEAAKDARIDSDPQLARLLICKLFKIKNIQKVFSFSAEFSR
jgi:hypothetical protein